MELKDLNLMSVGDTIKLAGSVFVGEGHVYLCMFPEDRGDMEIYMNEVQFHDNSSNDTLSVEVLNMDTEDWSKFLRQTDLLETEVLTQASDGKLAKAILRKSQRQIDTNVSWKVFKRDGYACRYCGKDDIPLTVDHLVLWEEGGPSTVENLVSSCKKCNKTRGNTQYPEWLKDPYYVRVSKNLSNDAKEANVSIVSKLDSIPRQLHKRSRK